MKNTTYFQKIAQTLSEEGASIPKTSQFVKLKKMEYWIRILRSAPQFFISKLIMNLMDKDSRELTENEMDQISPDGEIPAEKQLEILQTHFTEYAYREFEKADMENDPVFKRVQQLQNVLHLSDDEIQIAVYLWIDLETEIYENQTACSRRVARQMRGSDMGLRIAATGLGEERFYKAIGSDSLLSKLQIIDEDMNLDHEIELHFEGVSPITGISNIKKAGEPSIPFQTLAEDRPEAETLAFLLGSHDYKQPLNILLYGRAGTGKTELSKAIAAELGLTLYTIEASLPTRRYTLRQTSMGDSILSNRVRSIKIAAWKCENEKAIILVDEADQILNLLEKGSLNMLMEEIHVPIIWISNSMRLVEESTLRRFDYSIHFKNFNAQKRATQLHSVLQNMHAEDLISEDDVNAIAAEYPVTVGGMTLAVKHALPLAGERDLAANMLRKMLSAHANLLSIPCDNTREKATHAPKYSLSGINFDGNVNEVLSIAENFNQIWENATDDSAATSLNILLHGAPGTGKTEFVRFLARKLNRNLIVKRASDLLSPFVGETEENIQKAFAEAEESKSILFFDEADSFLCDRKGSFQNYEVTRVNELLTQMENFNCIFVAATNFENKLDTASMRRFALKLKFNYLNREGIIEIWNSFFPNLECPNRVQNMSMLAPGDFNVVYNKFRYLPTSALSAERIAEELAKEVEAKDGHANRKMGF